MGDDMSYKRVVRVKVTLLGDLGVGKTTFAKAYLGGKPISDVSYKPTIGADIFIKEGIYDIEDFGKVKVIWDIWDLSGQKAFRSICGAFLKGAICGIVVFDVSRENTLKNLLMWVDSFVKNAGKKPLIIVGNKIDLREKGIQCISSDVGRRFTEDLSKRMGISIPYVETSALYNINVEEAFRRLAIQVIRHLLLE